MCLFRVILTVKCSSLLNMVNLKQESTINSIKINSMISWNWEYLTISVDEQPFSFQFYFLRSKKHLKMYPIRSVQTMRIISKCVPDQLSTKFDSSVWHGSCSAIYPKTSNINTMLSLSRTIRTMIDFWIINSNTSIGFINVNRSYIKWLDYVCRTPLPFNALDSTINSYRFFVHFCLWYFHCCCYGVPVCQSVLVYLFWISMNRSIVSVFLFLVFKEFVIVVIIKSNFDCRLMCYRSR